MTRLQPAINRYLTRLGLAILLGIAAFAAAATTSFELPPLVQPPSAEHHTGKMIWADLITPDLAGAKYFYGKLFGWTFRDIQTGGRDYSIALLDGEPVAGIVKQATWRGQRVHPAWLTFISVPDVDQARQSIVEHGGKVLGPPREYAQRGKQAVFADPQGAVFAVLQSSSGDPPDVLADPGEWIWSAVITRDPDIEAAFYQSVFGYEMQELPSEEGDKHILLSSENYARVSSDALPPDADALRPHWLNFVRVTNATDMATKAAALGGKVLVPPHPDERGSTVAVIADPAGAPLGLIEWTDVDTKEVAK